MKTIKEWLETLESPYRDSALLQYSLAIQKRKLFSSLPNALENGFNWLNTPQGFGYWNKLYERLKEEEIKKGIRIVDK